MAKPIIISICNQKGGTGKTNVAINLAAYLSYFNKKILLIDLDSQGNATSSLGEYDYEGDIYEVLIQDKDLSQALKKTRENFWIIPASEDLAGAEVELAPKIGREKRLKQALDGFDDINKFDFIIIDTPPSLGLLTINSLVGADKVLIPVQVEYLAMEGLSQVLKTIGLVKKNLHPNLDISGTILTMFDKRSKLSFEVWEEMYKHFSYRIFKTVIPRNVALAEAPSYGKTILEYNPRSKGAHSYKRLAKEILFYKDYDKDF